MHTQWSDGSGTVKEMAHAATERGYNYIAITDHSKGLKIANGIDEKQLAAQGREIEAVNLELQRHGSVLTVSRSAEVNLSTRGEMDLTSAALGKLDLVLGSFHSTLRRTEDQTSRYVAALQNHNLHILGHPQGRVYSMLRQWVSQLL